MQKVIINQTKEIIEVSLSSLHDLQGSLKKSTPRAYEKFRDRVLKEGFKYLFFVWKDESGKLFIIDGHHRKKFLLQMQEEGIGIPDTYPAIEILAANKKEAATELLHLNSHYGQLTKDGLLEYLDTYQIEDIDVSSVHIEPLNLNFDMIVSDLTASYETDTLSDNVIPEDVDQHTSPGDVWELNNHRIICADCTDPNHVTTLMNGKKADMLFTDPPYNVDYSSKNELLNLYDKKHRNESPITNDNFIDFKEYQAFIDKMYQAFVPHLTEYNALYICGNYESLIQFYKMKKLKISNMLVWVKNHLVLGRMDYKNQHEFIMYGWVGKHRWYGKANETTTWFIDKPLRSKLHPTMKPIELMERAINNSTQSGNNIILDLFGGSGSTLIACEKTGRISYNMEIEPAYCDVMVTRWVHWMHENNREITKITHNGQEFEYASLID